MDDRADRLKAALRENLKRRKAHMRDRAVPKSAEKHEEVKSETSNGKTGDTEKA